MPSWRSRASAKKVPDDSERLAPLVEELHGLPRCLRDISLDHAKTLSVTGSESTEQNVINAHKNEDRTVFYNSNCAKGSTCPPFCMLGVLDGHDRAIASEFVSRRLGSRLIERIEEGLQMEPAFVNALATLEEELRETGTTSGCCVLSILLCGPWIWSANLGDCRGCFLPLPKENGPPEEVVWLSRDLKATKSYEVQRIRALGGHVNDGRCGGLEPTRTIGDFDVKEALPAGCISIIPEVRAFQVSCTGIIIMASDGVWDVTQGRDLLGLVSARQKEIWQLVATAQLGSTHVNSGVLKDLSHDLVCFSIGRESADDCTAIVALVTVKG